MSLVFISYSSKDHGIARRVAEIVRVLGFDIWMDELALIPGEKIVSGLAEAIARANVFIILLTKNSIKSGWVGYELKRALKKKPEGSARIVPLKFDDSEVPLSLAHLKWGDCRTTEGLICSLNLALSHASDKLPLPAEKIRQRYDERLPIQYAIRLVPSGALQSSGSLGCKEREYVFVGDYAEQCGRSLRQILSNLWAGDAYDEVVSSNETWKALIFEVGDINTRKLDLMPATWKAMFRIVSDPKRLFQIKITDDERVRFGRRPPYDYYTPDQDYWYGRLTELRSWRHTGQSKQVDGRPTLELIFGFSWWCYDGSGITHQAIRSSLASHQIASRLFLVKNVELENLNYRAHELGHVDEGKLLL